MSVSFLTQPGPHCAVRSDFVLSTMPLSPEELRIVKERLDPQPHKVRSLTITDIVDACLVHVKC